MTDCCYQLLFSASEKQPKMASVAKSIALNSHGGTQAVKDGGKTGVILFIYCLEDMSLYLLIFSERLFTLYFEIANGVRQRNCLQRRLMFEICSLIELY